MRAPSFAVLVLVAACTAPAPEPAPTSAPAPAPAASDPAAPAPAHAEVADTTRALFVANCAQCHGEQGDGEGVTQLDRKARSFLEGGFSYGNTQEAILRSITHGIPGTPMPPFEKALTPEQCAALAQYVIALGPERIVVDPSESEMVVRDRPLVVYGKLPPLVEGGAEIPRGIAIGTPDGLTFEYRADDVQLVRVRAGRFVNRTDWDGRGGTALEMLGTTIWSSARALNPVRLSLEREERGWPAGDEPRGARLLATDHHADRASVTYSIEIGSGEQRRFAVVEESCRAFRNSIGSGYSVVSTVRPDGPGLFVSIAEFSADVLGFSSTSAAFVIDSRDKAAVLYVARSNARILFSSPARLLVQLTDKSPSRVEVFVLTELGRPLAWNADEDQERLIQEFGL